MTKPLILLGGRLRPVVWFAAAVLLLFAVALVCVVRKLVGNVGDEEGGRGGRPCIVGVSILGNWEDGVD